ncbi:MAG TPA: DUF1501 domain-containing protein [Thermoanaerobaculia bacterium]|nr:DUF1501 domain-containing protein [Thermoanaerobaculia bacterium]
MKANRREFLKIGGAAVTISFLGAREILATSASGQRVVVVVQLAGGNDAINTFIPYTDPRYRSLRPTLAVSDQAILKVDSRMGMHPSLSGVVDLYARGKFAFINNVGFGGLDRSHFHCQDVWQSGFEEGHGHGSGSGGWLGRYADLYLSPAASSITSLAIGSRVPLGLSAGEVIPVALTSAENYDVLTNPLSADDRPEWISAIRSSYAAGGRDGTLDEIRINGESMFQSIDLMATIPSPSVTVTYPQSALGRGLELVARTLHADLGTRLVWVASGGFDTHSTQTGTHANLLSDVSDSLASFQADLESRGISERVVVMAWSEFGRRAQENASGGTDHGKAGSVFLLGDGIKGGSFYGEVPGLDALDDGDLPTQIDFRSVYWTLIESWLGNDPEPVLHGRYANLGFIEKETVGRRRVVRR